jgi:hypothetical protein
MELDPYKQEDLAEFGALNPKNKIELDDDKKGLIEELM